jgi:hypothetical protein
MGSNFYIMLVLPIYLLLLKLINTFTKQGEAPVSLEGGEEDSEDKTIVATKSIPHSKIK